MWYDDGIRMHPELGPFGLHAVSFSGIDGPRDGGAGERSITPVERVGGCFRWLTMLRVGVPVLHRLYRLLTQLPGRE